MKLSEAIEQLTVEVKRVMEAVREVRKGTYEIRKEVEEIDSRLTYIEADTLKIMKALSDRHEQELGRMLRRITLYWLSTIIPTALTAILLALRIMGAI